MSSATSIKRQRGVPVAVDSRPGAPPREPAAVGDAGLRPWHFFVLASLIAATAAVILSRGSSPEHLIFISLAIGAAGAAGAAFYRTLAPLATSDASTFSESLSARTRAALEREKALVLRSLKELEFDRAMGKLSPRDFDEMGGRLRARALSLMKQLDEEGAGYTAAIERELRARLGQRAGGPAPPAPGLDPGPDERGALDHAGQPACDGCGTLNDRDAAFCKRCGQRL